MMQAGAAQRQDTYNAREEDFHSLKEKVCTILRTYIRKKEAAKETGWTQEARAFLEKLSTDFNDRSFVRLYKAVYAFAGTLRSNWNKYTAPVLSFVYQQAGSTLKANIEQALKPYNPYAVKYIQAEVERQYRMPGYRFDNMMKSVHVANDYDNGSSLIGHAINYKDISADTHEVLTQAINNQDIRKHLLCEAETLGWKKELFFHLHCYLEYKKRTRPMASTGF